MPRPRFSEMLLQRRRQLGLTVEQASRILKLREDVLVAFEEGDFESMPQSGYAQGMLSSYARYLGLNAREVVDLFQEELYEYVNGSGSHELRRRTRDTIAGRGVSGYDVVNEAGSRPKAYVEYHGLLPTAGGPAGDMGNFATVTPARPRQSVPLAGLGPSAVAAYGNDAYSQQQRPYNQDVRRTPPAGSSGRASRAWSTATATSSRRGAVPARRVRRGSTGATTSARAASAGGSTPTTFATTVSPGPTSAPRPYPAGAPRETSRRSSAPTFGAASPRAGEEPRAAG